MSGPTPSLTTAEAEALVAQYGSNGAAAENSAFSKSAIQRARTKTVTTHTGEAIGKDRSEGPIIKGRNRARQEVVEALPAPGIIYRYILTCAQNNTALHETAWLSLLQVAKFYSARLMVSRFTYDKSVGARSAKPGTDASRDALWYDPRIAANVCDERVELAPGLVWCGEMNILPTAVRPLSGLEIYTGRRSGIFPHVKIALESIASGKNEGVKLNYTTGTVTQRNYIAKKAGLKADFHHCYGALLVEVDSEGSWWCRQLNADSEGTIYDLDKMFRPDGLRSGERVEAISWGDIHAASLDGDVFRASWGGDVTRRYRPTEPSMIDTLRPKVQFMHDVLDFRSRNHHDFKNPHKRYQRHVEGTGDVREEVTGVAEFLGTAHRDWCQTVVVDSNHDDALTRWLREADYRDDPLNAEFFLEAQLAIFRSIRATETGRQPMLVPHNDFHTLEWAITHVAPKAAPQVKYLRADESYVICADASGGIECGMHGHLGANGARGSAAGFAKMGRKAIVGHSHQAGIVDGVYVGGVSAYLDQGYNRGPSSWSHSHVVCYPNGKRAIITIWNGKWRAG
jgi:hypothetical protein